MIYVFLGTKAQYVKTAPVLRELDQRQISYRLIDSGQHNSLAQKYRSYFGIRDPDVQMRTEDSDLTSVWQVLKWSGSFCCRLLFRPKSLTKQLFGENNSSGDSICLVHGDTPTTLLSVLAARRAGIPVAHLEAGLRSYRLFDPFPEEIIRIITMRWANQLFVPSEPAMHNLKQMKLEQKAILLSGNTNVDSVRHFLSQPLSENVRQLREGPEYALISIHRAETILRKERLNLVINVVLQVAKQMRTIFCIHPPTRRQLEKFKLMSRLVDVPNLDMRDLMPYPEFIPAMATANLVMTDGGSIQEEAALLGTPCLLLRKSTEREDGLGQNVVLSEFQTDRISQFLQDPISFKREAVDLESCYPSSEICERISGQ